MEILKAVLVLGGLGLIFGIGLAIAGNKFAITVDSRLETVHQLLPGANCGACGNPGCFAFAENLLAGKVHLEACRVCRKEAREKIEEILNKKEGAG
jgi:Na+-translocating ferredoxin:NAD+ oxidoreductase subunit B